MKRYFSAILVFVLLITGLYAGCGRAVSTAPVAAESSAVSELPAASEEAAATETPPASEEAAATETPPASEDAAALPEDGSYTSKEDVALYLKLYGRLPQNFITKKEARELGWEGGSLEPYAPGKCIGGDWFGNYEELLPEEDGREYHECDIDTLGEKSRGPKRIVYSNDGLIYYTDDHYQSFTLLYGEEE